MQSLPRDRLNLEEAQHVAGPADAAFRRGVHHHVAESRGGAHQVAGAGGVQQEAPLGAVLARVIGGLAAALPASGGK